MKAKRKRYIQACETGGSIYGMKGTYSLRSNMSKAADNGTGADTLSAYKDFYKKQASAMEKLFRRGG